MTGAFRSRIRVGSTRLSVWPPLPLEVYGRGRAQKLPFPLGDPRCAIFALGRHALWHGVSRAGLSAGDEVLVPSYHHGSEIEALLRAGLSCRFYECTARLEPDQAELEDLLTDRTRALLVVHYLGFPQDTVRWRAWCDERRLLLVEDAAQAWLAAVDETPVGSLGDVSIFCLYKTFGIPEGAALVGPSRTQIEEGGRGSLGFGPLARRHAAWLRSRSSLLGRVGPSTIRVSSTIDDEFVLGDPNVSPSLGTKFLLPRIARVEAAARRRDNYAFLLARLGDAVAAPFSRLPEGASPFVFPIETPRKDVVLARLEQDGIHAFDFWSVAHPALPRGAFAHTAALRERIVGLPVHQELRRTDLERIADSVRTALGAAQAPARAFV